MTRVRAHGPGLSPSRTRDTLFLIVVTAFAAGRLGAQTTPTSTGGSAVALEELTVPQAIQEAIAHNLDLLAKRVDIPVAEAQLITASLRPNPVLSLGADHLDWLGTGFNGVNGGGPTELSARVDLPLERGRKRELRIDEAVAARSVAEARVADAVRTISETVELDCVDVMQASESLAVARDTLRTFENLAALNDDRVRAGAASPYEAVRARVAMLQFRATVARAELDLRTASIRLRQAIGRPPSGEPIHVDGLPALQSAGVHALASLEALALEHRPDLQAARLSEARSTADLRLQIALGHVDFALGSEYRRQAGPTSQSNSLGLFFSAPLPVSSRNQGEIARASAEGLQASRATAALEAAIRADVRAAFETYSMTADLLAGIERDLLSPAEIARDTAAYAYRAGGTTLVDLIDSQRAWNDAMQSYHDAQADYRRAVAHLNSALGIEVIQ
jgi:cobalt-zinc-cadmium efflux system outer membrane protein